MKRYDQLTAEQQEAAANHFVGEALCAILECAISFEEDNELQAKIDAACAKAESMQTPWFAGEYIMDTCADEIREMALAEAKECIYMEAGERAVHGIA